MRILSGDIDLEIDAVVLDRVHVETSIVFVFAFRAVLSPSSDGFVAIDAHLDTGPNLV